MAAAAYPPRPDEPDRCGIDRVRRREDPVRGARAHARRLRRALLAGRVVLRRGARRRAGGRRLRRGGALRARAAGRRHERHRAGARGQDLLLARALRLRPQHRAHRRHAAQRVRRVRAQALAGLARLRRALPRQHPARPPARGARAVREGAVRRHGLDEPVDRDGAGLARADDQGGRRAPAQRRRAARAHRAGEPRARRAGSHVLGPAARRGQAGRVRVGPLPR